MTTKRLRLLMRWLRTAHPVDMPVRIIRSPAKLNEFGYSKERTKDYVIWINSALPALVQELILMHEYSHVMVWAAQKTMAEYLSHDVMWGAALGHLWGEYSGNP